MLKFRKPGVTLNPVGRTVRFAIGLPGLSIITDLLQQNGEATGGEKMTKTG